MHKTLKRESSRLFCFSPPVMIATFLIETVLAVYVIFRYKLHEIGRLAVLMLISLATFQLAEFSVCGASMGTETWSRIGYVAIALLPPLGLHLTYAITKAKRRPLLAPAYISMVAFIAFFVLSPNAFDGYACLGNYVIFEVANGAGGLFGAYYYTWLAATLILGWKFIKRTKDPRTRRALGGVMAGYAVFIIPAVTANIVSPDVIRGMPSIMCGFAAILALLLVLVVLPNSHARKGVS